MFFQQRCRAHFQEGKESLGVQGSGWPGTPDWPGDARGAGPAWWRVVKEGWPGMGGVVGSFLTSQLDTALDQAVHFLEL